MALFASISGPTLTSPRHVIDVSEKEAARVARIYDLAGALEEVPGDLDRLFYEDWQELTHESKTNFGRGGSFCDGMVTANVIHFRLPKFPVSICSSLGTADSRGS
ncbi:hypothetical protein ACVIST_005904 [Bradyrhizobium elkanii]